MSKHIATVNINNNIEFKFSYGDWTKNINGEMVSSGRGYNYDDFLKMILHHYPLNAVDQFYLIS